MCQLTVVQSNEQGPATALTAPARDRSSNEEPDMSTVTRLPVAAKQHTGCPYCGLRGDEREPEPGVVIWGCMTVTNADDDAVYRSPGCVRMGGTDDEWDAEWIRLQDLISKRDAGII